MASSIAPKKPVPPPAAVGAPAEPKAKKEKKPKAPKAAYPALEQGKLTAVPTDFDPKVHKPLKKKDFESEPTYLEYVASNLDKKAASLRSQAEKLRTMGSSASSAKVKTLVKMQERMAELMATLKAEGIDVDSLMAK